MDELITVIVPVYNVEKHLKRCMDSILNQTYHNLEIITVDDGSIDMSYELCCGYAERDARVQVYHKKNEGLGFARNYGMRYAMGDYLMFVDSDDFLVADAIEELYKPSQRTDADIIIGSNFYKDRPVKVGLDERLYEGQEIKEILMVHMMGNAPFTLDGLSYTAWGKLYRTDFLKKNEFVFESERKYIWEDLEFHSRVMPAADRVYISHYPVYYYCFNEGSLTHRYRPDKLNLVMRMYHLMLKRIRIMNLPEEAKSRLDNNFIGHIRTCIKLEVFYSKENGFSTAIRNIKNICHNNDVQKLLDSYPKKYYNCLQKIYNYFLAKEYVVGVYCLTWLQNKRKRIE